MLKNIFKIQSFKKLIITASIIASLMLFAMSYLVTLQVFEKAITNNAHKNAITLSSLTFERMYDVMSEGWSREELENFIAETQEVYEKSNISIDIYRSLAVAEKYGKISKKLDPQVDLWVEDTFYHEKNQTHFFDHKITSLIPIKAQQKCLECHVNAKPGDTLGIMHITQDLTQELKEVENQFLMFFLLLLPLPVVIAFFVAQKVSSVLNKSIHILRDQVNQINKMKDLKKIDKLEVSKYVEFRQLGEEFQSLAHKLNSIAVDREVLEFEIKLLDKFIITSEVIKDWQKYLCDLLAEINKFMSMQLLYVSFTDPENPDKTTIEIFWYGAASAKLQQETSSLIEQELNKNLNLIHSSTHVIHHQIESSDKQLDSSQNISLKHKTLQLDDQGIHGQVGVGVKPHIMQDLTRSTVVESIVSTLLNVIGSIQAINKYTSQLEHYAMRDPLTNLFNQRIFNELLKYEISRSKRKDYSFTLMIIDFDNFKHINDFHGHSIGDLMLKSFASTVHKVLRTGDIFARYGGDEFAIILPNSDIQSSIEVANRILATVRGIEEITHEGHKVTISCSIGLASYPEHAVCEKELFIVADNMMYRSKHIGKDQLSIPADDKDLVQLNNTNEKAALLLEVLDNPDWIEPHFQPIETTRQDDSQEVHELLMRIRYKDEILSAYQFIDIAENMGIAQRLDLILINKAFIEITANDYQGLIFINLSPRSLIQSGFIEQIKSLAESNSIAANRVVFELTERETVRNLDRLKDFIVELKAEGFRFAIDDFGSGFSSYHYLKNFPIDYLKIEGSFISNLLNDNIDMAFVKSAVTLAKSLGIKTVAEFVETQEVLDAVVELDIDYAQGYYLGRPQASFKVYLKGE